MLHLPVNFLWARWFYLRLLAVGFLTAFLSLSTQIHGLIGNEGILPASELLEAVSGNAGGFSRFLLVPSLLWLGTHDVMLNLIVWGGFFSAALLLINVFPKATLFFCWFLYLSFVSAAQNFSGFQSDGLMLESTLLAIFIAPRGWRPGLGEKSPLSRIGLWMMWWLLFRLMWESGLVKILSGDQSWRSLTALTDYYSNCPFPTWIGYYVQHLPPLFHKVCAALALFTELVIPFFIVLGRRFRLLAFFSLIIFQMGILLTANYTYLNYNAIALAFFLLDDKAWCALRLKIPQVEFVKVPFWRRAAAGTTYVLITYVSFILLLGTMGVSIQRWPKMFLEPIRVTQHFRSANRYGLFAMMTHERNQVEFEGSENGRTWKKYQFKWQPQDLNQPPRFMAPHLPRFDWNLWFATLGNYKDHPFIVMAAQGLIQGKKDVESLFKSNPFEDSPPKMIRFPMVRYSFTDLETQKTTGDYWLREDVGFYAPTVVQDALTGEFSLTTSE